MISHCCLHFYFSDDICLFAICTSSLMRSLFRFWPIFKYSCLFSYCQVRVNLKGNESWVFIGRTDAEAETPILWPPVVKN